jgi:hypothetical protein
MDANKPTTTKPDLLRKCDCGARGTSEASKGSRTGSNEIEPAAIVESFCVVARPLVTADTCSPTARAPMSGSFGGSVGARTIADTNKATLKGKPCKIHE